MISTAKLPSKSQMKKTSGETYNVTNDRESFAPLLQQGNEYVDPVAFYDSQLELLSEPYFSLNDTAHRVANHTIAFKNIGNSVNTYQSPTKASRSCMRVRTNESQRRLRRSSF